MRRFREPIVVNVRTLHAPQSGVQRYARELAQQWGAGVDRMGPAGTAQGIRGHLWEQCVLPARLRGRLLFSPGNTGPLICRRQVVTIHDASVFDCPQAFTGMFARWYRWLLPRLAGRVARVVTVSAFSRDRLVHHLRVPAERIQVIPNGVTLPASAPAAEACERLRQRLRLPERFFLSVGSNDPRKDLRRLVAAFAQARPPGWELVLAGGVNPRLFAGTAFGEAEGVRVLGRVGDAELDGLYHLAGAFVFPSLYEGFGLPPLEAMARGCPVICADSSCLPEVCGPDRQRGGAPWYFRAGSTPALAQALAGFAQLPGAARAEMAAAGRRQAALYSWASCARATAAVLEEVADNPFPNPAWWASPAAESTNPNESTQ